MKGREQGEDGWARLVGRGRGGDRRSQGGRRRSEDGERDCGSDGRQGPLHCHGSDREWEKGGILQTRGQKRMSLRRN